MLFRYIIIIVLLFFSHYSLQSQGIVSNLGAANRAMGNIQSLENNLWAVFNNPSGLTGTKNPSIVSSYYIPFGLSELTTTGIGYLQPLGAGSIGLGMYKYGRNLYSEQNLGLSYAHKIGISSIGLRVNYRQYELTDVFINNTLHIDIGVTTLLGEKITVGAYLQNVSQSKPQHVEASHLNSSVQLAISYSPNPSLTFVSELQKTLLDDLLIKAGLAYYIVSKVALRTGLSITPLTYYAGLSIEGNILHLYYAMTNQQQLGFSHEISVAIILTKK